MANNSDAHGYVSLDGEWFREEVIIFYTMLLSRGYGYYWTTMSSDDSHESRVNNLMNHGQEPFVGTGRWSYMTNLDEFQNWTNVTISVNRWTSEFDNVVNDLKEFYPNGLTKQTYEQNRQKLFKSMYENNLKIVWDYVDEETGENFIAEVAGHHKVSYNPVKGGYTLEYFVDSNKEYDANLKNHCQIFDKSEERLQSIAYDIAKVFNFSNIFGSKVVERICAQVIKKHPTWYNLYFYSMIKSKDDLPEDLVIAMQLFVERERNL